MPAGWIACQGSRWGPPAPDEEAHLDVHHHPPLAKQDCFSHRKEVIRFARSFRQKSGAIGHVTVSQA